MQFKCTFFLYFIHSLHCVGCLLSCSALNFFVVSKKFFIAVTQTQVILKFVNIIKKICINSG